MKYQKPKSKITQTNKPEQNPIIKIVKESESNQESYAKFNFIQGKAMVKSKLRTFRNYKKNKNYSNKRTKPRSK